MRSIWKGAIAFGLVNIPVKLYSAVQSSNLDLDMLDERDHARIKFQRVNENTGKVVPYEKIVRGYLLKDRYIVLTEKDLKQAEDEKSKLIELENFIDSTAINPIYFETSYYTEPEKQGNKAYSLLLKALQQTKKVGLARFVLRKTEHLCIIHPINDTLVVTKIRFQQEIRKMTDLNKAAPAAITKKEMAVGIALIKQYTGDFDIASFKDEYSASLLKLIKAKAKGKRTVVKKMHPVKASSENLYDQLLQSLNGKKKA
jgi:DNA end-binding protein Ku